MIRVLIGVPTGERAREAKFYDYLDMLQLPMGTMKSSARGPSIAKNRNLLVRKAIDNGCSHIFFVDDDSTFQPDALIKLLCHNVDIVSGFQLHRNFPHFPLIFSDRVDNNFKVDYIGQDETGLKETLATGLGACLIKCKVFSKLEEPWFRMGELEQDGLGEDLGFFSRVRDLGLKAHVDLDVPVGHITSVVVTPARKKDKWTILYDTNGSDSVEIG